MTSEAIARTDRILARLKPARLTPAALAGAAPDPSKPWVPEALAPLARSARFAALTRAQQLRYNHCYAMLMAEQFLWLEETLAVTPLKRLLARGAVPAPLRALFESFVADEESHTAALFTLLQQAAPELYPQRRRYFFQPPARLRALCAMSTAAPRRLPAWALFTAATEELTIQLNRVYQDDAGCDPLFARAHALHAQDEARHCQIDTILCDWLLEPLGATSRALTARLIGAIFQAYYDPDWGLHEPIDGLILAHPELAPQRDALVADVVAGRSTAYRQHLYSEKSAPLTARLAQRHPMLADAIAGVTRG